MILRVLWWRIRYVVWWLRWRALFGLAQWRTLHGMKVGVAPVLDDHSHVQAFRKVEAALGLIAASEPRHLRRILRDMDRIWIDRDGYAPAYFLKALRLCVIDREFLITDATEPSLIAAVIVHEATHARLYRNAIHYVEPLRSRIEAICDAESAAFARRLPEGELLARRILKDRPNDANHWSDQNLDRRLSNARLIELESAHKEIDDSNLPTWLKKLLHRVVRSLHTVVRSRAA